MGMSTDGGKQTPKQTDFKPFSSKSKPNRPLLSNIDNKDFNQNSVVDEKIVQLEQCSNTVLIENDTTAEGISEISFLEGTGGHSSMYIHSTPKNFKNIHLHAVGNSTIKPPKTSREYGGKRRHTSDDFELPEIEIWVGKNEKSKEKLELSLNKSENTIELELHEAKTSKKTSMKTKHI